MLLLATVGILLSVVSMSTLVVGDPTTVIVLTNLRTTNNPNDYFDSWVAEFVNTKRTSQLNVKIPIKKEIPSTVQLKMVIGLPEQDPFEYVISLCDALTDPSIGASFVKAGLPKDKFPRACPVNPGDFSVLKWDPPVEKIPPGLADGQISGSISFLEEDKTPYVQIDFEGQMSHALPSVG